MDFRSIGGTTGWLVCRPVSSLGVGLALQRGSWDAREFVLWSSFINQPWPDLFLCLTRRRLPEYESGKGPTHDGGYEAA